MAVPFFSKGGMQKAFAAAGVPGYTGMGRPNTTPQTASGNANPGSGDSISGYWSGGPSGGATNTNGGYTNPGMGPKPIPGNNGTDTPGGGTDKVGPLPWTTGGPRPSTGGTPGAGDGNTLQPIGWGSSSAPTNTQWGSTGTWSSGSNVPGSRSDGFQPWNAPMVNQQTTTGSTGSGAPAWAAQAFNAPYAGTSTINPASDLRATQITPQNSPRTAQTQRMVDGSARAVASGPNYTGYQSQNPNDAYTQTSANWMDAAFGGLGAADAASTGARGMVSGTGYGPGASATINPTISGDWASQAFNAAQGGAGAGGVSYGGDTTGLRSRVTQGVDTLYGTPDRTKLAADAFSLFDERSQPGFEQSLRRVNQAAAAGGRVGAGMTTNELGDVATLRERELAQQKRQLANEAAGLTLSDNIARLGATQGAFGQLAGTDQATAQIGNSAAIANTNARQSGMSLAGNLAESAFGQQRANRSDAMALDTAKNNLAFSKADLERGIGSDLRQSSGQRAGLAESAFGMGSSLRGENRTDQLNNRQFQQGDWNASLDRLGALSGLEGQQFGQDTQFRDELRGERGYQGQLEDQGYQRARDQYLTEQDTLDRIFGRQGQQIGWANQVGNQYNPTGVLSDQVARADGQSASAMQGAGDLLQQYLARQRTAPRPSYAGG